MRGAMLAAWGTPSARDWKSGDASQDMMDRNSRPLNEQAAQLASWPTPMAGSPATDRYNEAGNTDSSRQTQALVSSVSGPARLTASEQMRIGSDALTCQCE